MRGLIQKLQRNLRFFRNLRDDEVLLFIRLSKSKTFKDREIITCPEGGGDCLCLLVNGEVTLQASDGRSFQVEPGVLFRTIPLSKCTAVATGTALIFYVSQGVLNRHMPSLMDKYEVCPLGIRSKELGQLCLDPAEGKFFQPRAEILRSFCKWKNSFHGCPHYVGFREASEMA